MKNLLYLIDKLEDLPVDTLSLIIKKKDQIKMWQTRSKKSDRHSPVDRYKSIYGFINFFLDSRIGQSFDEVFRDFCKQTKKYHQKYFLTEFENGHKYKIEKGYYRWSYYYVDDDGLIQYYNATPKVRNLKIPSDDYKTIWVNKKRGLFPKLKNSVFHLRYYATYDNKYDIPYYRRDEYEEVVVSGEILEFKSRRDPKFIRMHAERRKKSKLKSKKVFVPFRVLIDNGVEKREENIKWTEQAERTRLQREEATLRNLIREEEANLVKIISHGFDPVNSFRHKPIKKNGEDNKTS